MSPALVASSPAIIRSSVDLPQPEGPTNTQNSPSATARSTPWITCDLAEGLDDAGELDASPSFDAGRGDAGRDVALQEREHERDRQEREHRHREQVVPLRAQLALERVERELQRELLAAVSTISGQRKSFQRHMIEKIASTASAGAVSGSTIRQ